MSAPTINAIPTTLDGITYRSRLEARWAMFFGLIGVNFEYEPEGYSDGTVMYLPDFWIPSIDAFFEIKPSVEYDETKPSALVKMTEKDVYVTTGRPHDQQEGIHVFTKEGGWDNYHEWCACPHCKKLGIEYMEYGGRICWDRCLRLPKSVPGWPMGSDPVTSRGSIACRFEKSSSRNDEINDARNIAGTYQFSTATSPKVHRVPRTAMANASVIRSLARPPDSVILQTPPPSALRDKLRGSVRSTLQVKTDD